MSMMQRLLAAARDLAGETPEEQWAQLVQNKLPPDQPPFTPFWWRTLGRFWRSGKTALIVLKANRAGGTTHIARMCSAPEMLFRERHAIAESEFVWANASATVPLANGSLRMVASALRALGLDEVKRRSKDELKRIAPMQMFVGEGSVQTAGTIECLDISGNRVEYRSQPASRAGLSGFTGIGFTPDEVELWKGEAEQPEEVLELGLSRLKGQPGAHTYAISRAFSEEGVLYKMAMRGDTESLMIARLGEDGARDDETGRLALREHLRALGAQGDRAARRHSQDVRLVEEADPASPIIPAWAGIGPPEATILECWKLAVTGFGLEEGEVPLDGLLRVYGGRPTGREGERFITQAAIDVSRVMICIPAGYTGRQGAGFDPAVTLNSCALAIVRERRDEIWEPREVRTWQGEKDRPLDLRLNVGPEAAEIVKGAGLLSWRSDLFARADVQLVSRDAGIRVSFDEESVLESYGTIRLMLHRLIGPRPDAEARLVLRSDDPGLDDALALIAKELAAVLLRRKSGKGEIVIPVLGGQHGDRARALVRALRHAGAGKEPQAFRPTVGGVSAYAEQSRGAVWYPRP